MGCDIHTYVEYADFDAADGEPYWVNFTRNGGSRNYLMFGVLAGVRYPEAQFYEPNGMPEGRLGFDTSDDYWLHVAPASNPEWADNDDNWVSLERAQSWVNSGCSVGETDKDGRLRRVSDPGWHSHSWLTLEQLALALEHYKAEVSKRYPGEPNIPAEWAATLAAMREFEANGKPTRLVFWFDN